MLDETMAQYRHILDTGLKVEFIDYEKQGDPYARSPRLAVLDVVENNHLWVFSTRDGFGSDDAFDASDNPLLGETEFEISGQPLWPTTSSVSSTITLVTSKMASASVLGARRTPGPRTRACTVPWPVVR
jgi:hypothetical protein